MELESLKQDWHNQEFKDELIVRLFKESRRQKADTEFRKMTIYSLLFMVFNLLVNIYAWLVMIPNSSNTSIVISGISVLILTYVVFYMNVQHLSLVSKINILKPVIEVQKVIGRLKLLRVRHNRFIFIFSNLFFWSLMVLVFKIDFELLIPAVWEKAAVVPIIHISFAILWFPLSLWILKKYDSNTENSKFWTRLKTESFLTDESLNYSLNNSLEYLREIEAFEKEQ